MKKPLLLGIILTACIVIVTFVFAQFYPGGMISYWKFEGSGATALDSVDANDGTIYGATRTTGQVGGALSFDGTDDYVDCGNVLNVTNKLTIEAWVKDSGVSYGNVVGKFEAYGKRWHIYIDSIHGSALIYWNIGGSTYATSSTSAIGTDWHHLAMVYDGTQSGNEGRLKAYIDGAPITLSYSGTIPATMPAISANVNIGRHDTVNFFKGLIDEAAIYGRALSAGEIEQHFQNGLNGSGYEVACVPPPDNMVSWWQGDTNANDIINGNHGTLVNGATFATGMVDQAFSFDGVDDYVSIAAIQIIGDDTSFTIDAWIKVNGFAAGNKQLPIYGEYYRGTYNAKNYLAVGNTQPGLGRRVFFDQFEPTKGYLKSNIQLTPGRWYHVAYTQDGTTRYLYIDGTLDNSDSAIEKYTGPTPNDVRIGRRGGTANNMRFDGLIDELEIFDRALSAEEIQAIYNAGSAGKCKVAPVIDVDIDIKPESDPNSINLGAHGLLPVAILGSAEFDVTTIDPYSVEIEGVEVAKRGSKKAPKLAYSYEDVNEDGNIDMMTFFDVWRLVDEEVLTEGTTELSITATLDDGTPIKGTDSVNIVPIS